MLTVATETGVAVGKAGGEFGVDARLTVHPAITAKHKISTAFETRITHSSLFQRPPPHSAPKISLPSEF